MGVSSRQLTDTEVSKRPNRPVVNILIRILVCTFVLIVGVVGMKTLAALKKPPAEVRSEERPLQVEAVRAVPEDVPVFITGYGEVAVLNTVAISPEVSGRIVYVHPRLEAGEIIEKGDLLFRIDDADYRASLLEAGATVEQFRNAVLRLEKQYAIDRRRLKTLERNRALAKAEFERMKKLHKVGKAVSRSGLDGSEQQYNTRSDLADQMAETIDLYPMRLKEAESGLEAAEARRTLAETRLLRCEVRSPFKSRVKRVSLEVGQYVNPGSGVLTLSDDSILEIRVPVDSRDARQWLVFERETSPGNTAWFNRLAPAVCSIRWTEDRERHIWQGRIDRVVAFNKENRTLTVAVRIEGKNAWAENGGALPLVEGMFCSVEIPGKTLNDVFRLPRWSVSFDGTVYVADDNRLKTVPVTVARIQGEEAIVSDGIQADDRVITTRMVDPLENSLLEITN